jgi:protein-L-isoaspartate(D-aspartate) O-methyltransferase
MTDFAAARHNMVEGQIRTNKVTDPAVIAAFRAVPRELFVPKSLRGIAYADEDLPVKAGRYLLEPLVLARLAQIAAIAPTDTVLDVGPASGYSTAIVAKIAGSVVAVESDAELASQATRALGELGLDNAAVVTGPLERGYAKQAPYEVILLNGAIARVPNSLLDQLAEGGRLVAVIDGDGGIGRATLMIKRSGVVSSRVVFDASSLPLPGFAVEAGFVF